MAGFSNTGDLSHALESLIVAIVDQRIRSSQQILELLQQSLDSLNLMQVNAQNGQPVYPVPDLLRIIEELRCGGSETFSRDRLIAGNRIAQIQDSSPKINTENHERTAKHIVDKGLLPQKIDTSPLTGSRRGPGNVLNRENVSSQELVRIRATLIDRLVNNAGEVNIYHARLGQQIASFGFNLKELDQTVNRLRSQLRKLEMETEAQILFGYEKEQDEENKNFDPLELDRYSVMQQLSRALSESVSDLVSIQDILVNVVKDSETLLIQQSRISTDLQEGLMRARMTQFSTMGPRLRRIARQTASELNKKVNLTMSGEGNELDRSVLDRMVAPLEHMLRNAISHGIESPDKRQIRGKPLEGNVHISVDREASEVVIKVKDDGAGIDICAVRAKAEKQGLISTESNLPDYEIMQLILESGFSTAEEITQISGRGVGLDVVNSEIKELSGVLSINSLKEKGTTFIVRLPFTLAINQALLVQSGEDLYAVPLASLEGIVRLSADDLREKYTHTAPLYEYGGSSYELKHLGAMLGMSQPVLDEIHSIFPVLLVRSGDYRVALQVEGLLGSREVVVKPVGPQISKLRGISGATILGDGRVVLILDVPGLIRIGAGVQLVYSAKENIAQVTASSLAKVMVVDDSITIRKFTSRMLERNKFEVKTAKDGIDAMGKLQDYIPDLVLLDIEMPRMDGYELATHIRNTESLKTVPIIMITSRTGEKHRLRAIELGVNRYLGKPYKESELLENIREILDLKDSDSRLKNIV
jgi:chemosensory pili system protein ChpA (sensor histidine kinase/response regulator)